MSNKMNLIFEPADLEQASPATVSRCGMIYMEPTQMGWKPMKESYMQHELPANLTQEHRELVEDLFEWLVQPCLDFISHNCRLFIQTSHMHMVFTLQRMYSCLMDEIIADGAKSHDPDDPDRGETLSNSQVKGHHSRLEKQTGGWGTLTNSRVMGHHCSLESRQTGDTSQLTVYKGTLL